LTRRRRRIGAYGLCRSGARVLLARASAAADFPGLWQVPGGGLDHGEHPADAVVREFREETGLTVAVRAPRTVVAEVREVPDLDVAWHSDRIVFDVEVTGGALRAETAGSTDRVAWLSPAEAAAVPLMPFTAELLGLPVGQLPPSARPAGQRAPLPPVRADRGQRFAAYGLATDPAGRVLLTLIAPGYPGAGRWHLPGGGTDFGEQPAAGLLRELVEETGQTGTVTALLSVGHRHNPAALGPEGHPMDWHAVRVVYRVAVPAPTEATVTEAAGGSTAQARWFARAETDDLALSEVAADALASLSTSDLDEFR
jgi:8-oxo-dGTP diphosphatase